MTKRSTCALEERATGAGGRANIGYFIGNEEARLQRPIRAAVWFSSSGLDRMVKCSMGGFGTDDGGTNYANLSHR